MALGGFGMPVAGGWPIDQMGWSTARRWRPKQGSLLQRLWHGTVSQLGEQPSQSRPSANWRVETGFAPLLLSRQARFFDLVVLGRSDRVVDLPHTDTIEETSNLFRAANSDLLERSLPRRHSDHHCSRMERLATGRQGRRSASLQLLTTARTVRIIVTIGTEHEESTTRL